MRPTVPPQFKCPHMRAQVMDELHERLGASLRLRGMDLVEDIPGEEDAVAAPALDSEGEPALDRLARAPAKQHARGMIERPAVLDIVWVPAKMPLRPEGVERGQKNTQPGPLAKKEEVIPQAHHIGGKNSRRTFEIAVPNLRILHHEPEAGDAVGGEPGSGVSRLHRGRAARRDRQVRSS